MSGKEFDITQHEFSDSNITHDGDTLNITHEQWGGFLDGYSVETLYLEFNKQDAIAIAKHFNLTAEDLGRG